MGDKAASVATRAAPKTSSARARGSDWSKSKEPPKRRRGRQQASESEEEEEEDEEEEEEEEEADGEEEAGHEEDGDANDDSETGSDSGREQRAKKSAPATRKPSPRRAAAKKATKDDGTRGKADKPTPSGAVGRRRRGAAAAATKDASEDGSETASQGATDDEMNGRRGTETTASKAVKAEAEAATAPTENDRRREWDRERQYEGGDRYRESERDLEHERNSSMTLPSLSRAAMLHMNREESLANGYSADPSNRSSAGSRGRGRERSRSRSRERATDGAGGGNRWNDSNNNQPKENGRGGGNDDDDPMNNYSGGGSGGGGRGGGGRDDEPGSPNHDGGQDVRIMFHGREIYADDLIGLRVAKTFVGHGRFLGQVVKFDEPTSLYTIVYADGDAEELSIENTIQILIQDEIERADPSVPPVPMAFRNDRMPDSPEAGSVTPASSTTTVSVPVAPLNASVAIPPPSMQQQPPGPQQSQLPPVYPSRRSTSVAFTEREAQFVMGMFENNALPVLLRQGWRVQSNAAGTEQRFYAPPGSFRGAGHVFLSAFDVVELIVFDNELLSACFPQNMHSVILSLFSEAASASSSASSISSSRKRGSPAPDNSADGYDSKRVRGGYPGGPGGPGVGIAPMGVRAGGGGPGGSMGMPPSRGDERLPPPVGYRSDDLMDGRGSRDRDGYGGPPPQQQQRMTPLASSDRFPPPSGPTGRGEPSGDGYRRGGPAGDYRSMPLRSMADGPPSSSRWAGPPPGGDPSDYHHRRAYGDGPEWSDRDALGGRGGGPPTAGYMGGPLGGRPSSGSHRDEPNRGGGVYYSGGDRGPLGARGTSIGGPVMGRPGAPGVGGGPPQGDEPVPSYGRYRDARAPPPPSSSGGNQYSPESFSNRYPPSRGEPPASDFRGPTAGGDPPPPQGMADRFARPLSRGSMNGGPPGPSGPGGGPGGRAGFSMMDVDRNVSGGGGYDHRMERGRSPHLSGPPPSGSYGPASHLQPQHYGHHQRSGSNGGAPNPADDSRTI